MKTAMSLSLIFLSTTLLAQNDFNQNYYGSNVSQNVPYEISQLDNALNCADMLDWQVNSINQQSFLMQKYVNNIKHYGVENLIKDTPKLKAMTQEFSEKYGLNISFVMGGLSQKSILEISSHEKSEEIFELIQSEKYSNYHLETYSLSRLVTRGAQNVLGNAMLGQGFGYGLGGGFGYGQFPTTTATNNYWGPNLEISYIENENKEQEIKLNAMTQEYSGLQGHVESNISSSHLSNETFLLANKKDLKIKYDMGFNISHYKVYQLQDNNLLQETSSPFEVCSLFYENNNHSENVVESEMNKEINSGFQSNSIMSSHVFQESFGF